MTIQDSLDAHLLEQTVDVLRIVPQKLTVELEQPHESMTGRRDEVGWIDLFRKRVEHIWSVVTHQRYRMERSDVPLLEECQVKHLLRILKFPVLLFESGVQTRGRSEVWDAARSTRRENSARAITWEGGHTRRLRQ